MNRDFAHLHTHSHYSLLDATCTIKGLVSKAKEHGMSSLALTDHGNLFGAIEFYNEAKKAGIKPIIGCELYVSKRRHTDKTPLRGSKNYHHLVVLAKNASGYRDLIKIASIAYTEGFYYKPRIDKETLSRYCSNLIGLTACLGGEVPHLILGGELEKAKAAIIEYRDMFGDNSFYLELQDHGIDKQAKVNDVLIELSRELSVPLVATNDIHYLSKEDRDAHDVLLCIGSQNKVKDEKRKRYYGDEFYFKSHEEMLSVFPDNEEALENTLKIASMCDIELDTSLSLPSIDLPSGHSMESYLRELCDAGIRDRYSELTDELRERLSYELSVICDMGFAGYFLIVWDFISWARENGILVGPGRGSVAGSLVSYSLGITDIDPIKYGLIFERFLNPERVSMPDIDTDFQDDKRDLVIKYVQEKYGSDKVASIITFGALKARAVVRDVGRVLDVPFSDVDRLAKLIPGGPKSSLEAAYNDVEDMRLAIDGSSANKKLFALAKRLEGVNRHAGTHAAGIVISGEPLSNLVPLYSDSRTRSISTQFEGKYLEEVGLLKMDFLGLKNLTVIDLCLSIIRDSRGIDLDMDKIPLDDIKVYELLKRGETLGVFQLEGRGMQELMGKLGPGCFEDIIALIALYRPGPLNSGMAEEFIVRKRDSSKVDYGHSLLEPILSETYGVIVYQEQVMEIARVVGGFSMARADILRKAMGKKQKKVMDALMKEFMDGASSKGIDSSLSHKLYENMCKFGEYGFNKSHSAAYALVTYRTAYLKANYPIEYMTALLSCDKDSVDKIVEYISEVKRMGINILAPSLNSSRSDFSVEDNKIRFGLSAIKNVGGASVSCIIKERVSNGVYKSIFDLCERVDARSLNKKSLESLIKAGVFDEFSVHRAAHISVVDNALERGNLIRQEKERGQFSLFASPDDSASSGSQVYDNVPLREDLRQWDKRELLLNEKEVLGFYFSGNPLDKELSRITRLNLDRISELRNLREGKEVFICGLVVDAVHSVSKKGTNWAKVSLDGLTGSCEVLFFKDVYKNARSYLEVDKILYIRGKLDSTEPHVRLFALTAKPFGELSDEEHISFANRRDRSRQFGNRHKNGVARKRSNVAVKPSVSPKSNSDNGGGSGRGSSKSLVNGDIVNISIKSTYLGDDNVDALDELRSFCLSISGNSPIFLHLPLDDKVVTVKAGSEFNINRGLADNIKSLACVERVWTNS